MAQRVKNCQAVRMLRQVKNETTLASRGQFSFTPLVPYLSVTSSFALVSVSALTGNISGGFVFIPSDSVPSTGVWRHTGNNCLPYILFSLENSASHHHTQGHSVSPPNAWRAGLKWITLSQKKQLL